ncbi:uncharacterized protein LOC131595762 [Vicia villosa]|uniref:uncharacterized protein LOC131595762 n=1 Tax=Vicia villosa TaxID=3911 RepID=UPI00273AC7AA|nr:uncharacterized protein LOC131595762 [Vicia villosa]
MADNNNIPSSDPFLLQELIEESSRELANHRRGSRRRQSSGHETQDTQLLQVLQQVQNVDHVPPEGHVQNGEPIRTTNVPEHAQNVNETDPRDGQHASSFTHTSERQRARHGEEEEPLNIPEGTDPITVRLLKEIQLTNSLLRIQDDRIHELERQRRRRPSPRRRYRSRSYSSSRSPPRRYRRRSPSSSRSPPRRHRRRRTRSRSPHRKNRKNQKPETAEQRSPSPEQGRRGPSKATTGNNQEDPRRNRHYDSPGPSDEEDFRSPLSASIRRARLPRGMEKPPALDQYDGTTDPDDHIRSIEAVMDYHVVRGSIKCRIFPTTLRKGAMNWYRNLPSNSIHSWTELKELFLSHFTASRRQPKSEANLEAVVQGPNEPLRDYLERFNKEAVQVQTKDYMKRYILERGLLPGSDFKKAIKIEKVNSMNDLLSKAKVFIDFEEGEAAAIRAPRGSGAARSSNLEDSGSRRGQDKRRDDRARDVKERRGPAGRFNDYTPLNTSREKILSDCQNAEFKKSNIRPPKSNPTRPGTDKSKYCKYHKSHGHMTDECVHLKDAIETLIKEGHLAKYTKKGEPSRRDIPRNSDEGNSPDSRPLQVALSVTRPEDFIPSVGVTTALSTWEHFPTAMVISNGGDPGSLTVSSVKRKFDELLSANADLGPTLRKFRGKSEPITFYLEELPGGAPNATIPLLVRARMANFDVRRVLVDEGSSVDIMYSHLFQTLQLDDSHLTPYVGSDLQGFNGATTKPWGYVELIVTFGEGEASRQVKTRFLVIDCKTLYNCIIGRPTLAELTAVPSTVHLKMKFYTRTGKVATINADIEAARRIFDASVKGLELIAPPTSSNKKPRAEDKRPREDQVPTANVSSVDLDARFTQEELKTGEETQSNPVRPVPDGDFELIPLGDNPNRAVKIGKGIPDLPRKQLIACLRANADLFAWSAAEMPGLDPEVACHHLSINPTAKAVVQRRRRQSPEKAEAAEKAVKDLLEASFISEAKYSTWLSNVVLVKKSNGKWRMCVDYTDVNRACPKDAYPLPNIDRLVDNSAGYKLLSFMDAYSGYNQIPMAKCDKQCTAFMTESGNYYYNVMPFGLKNAGATYQRMMNKVFRGEIGDTLEVYMDDMIVKSREDSDHTLHLERVFKQARSCRMRFNPEKCTFGVRAGKFLGFYLTERGIEANPDKCRAFSDLPTPTNKKSIQVLNGMLTALSRFVAKSAQHALPFFKLLRKEAAFEWSEECEQALSHLKQVLSKPPVLSRPDSNEVLYLYLAVSGEAASAALIRETEDGQKPVYFTSKALQGPEVRYQQIEKIALALITAARRLRYYFLAHTIVVRTDQPIKQLLSRPDMAGRMLKWSLELSEFDIQYEGRKALKAQALADFVAEMTTISNSLTPTVNKWTIYVDGASSHAGSGAGIILENDEGLVIEVSLVLSFATSNNQAEYEALLAGLRLAEDVGAREVMIYTDSQLVASQVSGDYQAKNDTLAEYLSLVKEKMKGFAKADVAHIPREHNSRADLLSKLASTRKKGGNKSVIQEVLSDPSVAKNAPAIQVFAIGDDHCWMTPVYKYLMNDELPDDPKEASAIKRRACSYTVIENKLYRRGFSIPLLKCIDDSQAMEVLQEIHEGINGQHLGGRSLARKALRAGYYWPTMQQDAKEHVQKCDKCQRHADMHLAPPTELKSLSSPWPFSTWGMDLLGPFPVGSYQNKYLVVAVDYFTKWIEAEALAKITSQNVLRFYKRNILARFGVPQAIITDNGTQFTDKKFQEFVAKLGTKQHFTSVEHPQTNGQAEAANRVILRGLKRRLGEAKKAWVEELHSVLWAYRTTPHSSTGETPFRLTYGTEAVIPVEIREPSRRTEFPLEEELNDEAMREELDMVEEIRAGSALREAKLKQQIALRHNAKVIKREFEIGALVLRRNMKDSREGKLAPNWEGPYRVYDKTENGAYYLENLLGEKLARPWNAEKLRRYYS